MRGYAMDGRVICRDFAGEHIQLDHECEYDSRLSAVKVRDR
jgi:hypothetical protein